MARLDTRYLGLDLECPLVASSSPLTRDLDGIRRLEDQGIGAVVLPSLFEEQLASTFEPDELQLDPRRYLNLIQRAKEAVEVPVIASLNAATRGRCSQYASTIEKAGADALELDLYKIPADPSIDSAAIESVYCELVCEVKSAVSIPVAVKISPYFTALTAVIHRLDAAGADGLVLFNRFYQPTIDIEQRRLATHLELSTSAEGALPAMWIAILKGQVQADLAATTGVHSGLDAVRMIMAGANVAMVCSALLRDGVEKAGEIRRELDAWLDGHEVESIDDIRGAVSRVRMAGSQDFLRTGYAKVLHGYRPERQP
ncbi:MAG: dihydroorotate dehydrogenase-like protein [Candidatus Binatia bacterium]